jgi:hypothetical protein
MIKRGLLFGVIGALISFGSIFFFVGPETTEKEIIKPSFKASLNGWTSLGEILSIKVEEPVYLDDDLFLSILMEEFIKGISDYERITITRPNNSIFWDTELGSIDSKYKDWTVPEVGKGSLTSDSTSMSKTPIKEEGRDIGYVYIKVENKPNPERVSLSGWKNFAAVLSYSLGEEVASKNSSEISEIMSKIPRKNDLLHLTILAEDNTILWDMDETLIGQKYKNGWIGEWESSKGSKEKVYIPVPIEFQGEKKGETHLLVSLPVTEEIATGKPLLGIFPIRLFSTKDLVYPIVSFVLLFLVGGLQSRRTATVEAPEKADATQVKEKRVLEAAIEELKKDQERLENKRIELTSEIAEKQKVKKDLESDIKIFEKTKEAPVEETEIEAFSGEKEEKMLFDNLFGEDEGEASSERAKEELNLTQRIVGKRREEIALSARVEAKRKELIELERKIDEAKG